MKTKNKSKSILIIGMGRFGKHLAINMANLGNEIMIIDKDETIIQEMITTFDNALVGDCTNENVISALAVSSFDICFVTIGSNFEANLIITLLLKKYNANYIVTKAGKEIQIDPLKIVGANEVVYPEKEMAEKVAFRFNTDKLLNYIELTKEYDIYEVKVPNHWIGKTIISLDVRKKYNINILVIKNNNIVQAMPSIDYTFNKDDQIVVIGKYSSILSLLESQ